MLICGKYRLDKEEGKSRNSRRGLGEQEHINMRILVEDLFFSAIPALPLPVYRRSGIHL